MKWIAVILLLCTGISLSGQTVVVPRSMQVTINKTTNLIFPATIVSVDRGSEQIVVQKSTPNILRVKADTVFNDTTNLSVITSDGRLYSFLICYSGSPTFLNLDLGVTGMVNKDTALYALSEKIIKTKNNLHGIRYSSGGIKLSLVGMYATGEVAICKFRIENSSVFSFVADRVRCFVTGSQSYKRRPSQEVLIEPLLINPVNASVKQKQAMLMTLILPKAALGNGKSLQIELSEKGGERQLSVGIPNKFVLSALLIQ